MKKILLLIIVVSLCSSCQVRKQTGEMVIMPEGYTIEQTNLFLKSILTQDFKESIYNKFPEWSRFTKGGFRYQPVKTQSFTGGGSGVGVIVKIYDLDDWERKDLFEKHVLHHLKNEVHKIKNKS